MFRPWRSFPTMVALGLVVGFATGGFPVYSREVSEIALVLAMTVSLTEISFRGISPRAELRWFLLSFGMSYLVLGGLILAFALLSPDPEIHDGWVLMAAVPPAIAVVPITSYLKGDIRRVLISLAFLYLMGLIIVPVMTLALTSQVVPIGELVVQTILLIGVPIAASRPLRGWSRIGDLRPSVVGLSFFVLVTAISGSTRDPLLTRPDLLLSLGLLSFGRTFLIGTAAILVSGALRLRREERVAVTAFSSFKNLGLTVVLAFAVFGPIATLPSIVSLVFEILWLAALPLLFRAKNRGSSTVG